ncbi:MAG: ATP-dependent helicase [Thermoplasmata archaeon]|nr:ATP-dependent helicase [Thermoplasmata archaeon]
MQRSDKAYTKDEVMSLMQPLVSTWFNERFTTLTDPQSRAIPVIHNRENVLVSSPTGSGKTLTAFMSIIDELTRYANEGSLEERVYCIYISPLKALANDVNRNLNTPLAEMRDVAIRYGMNVPDIRVGVRSGDTSQYERQKMLKHPPHILITTPESLALILEAPKFKEKLDRIEWLILDEIHDICDSKRGAFLSLTVERLQHHCSKEFTRIGLSATLAPIEAVAGYLVGCNNRGEIRDVTLIESASKKTLDLKVICPTDDMTRLSSDIVNSMMYDTLKELIEQHDTTLVFTNTRSGAESVVYKLKERGLENIEVHHSSLGKEIRLDVEERLKRGEIKCVVSSTSLELGIDIGSVDLVCQIGSPKSVAKGLQRIGRSGHSFGKVAKGRLLVFDPDDLVECAVMCRAAHRNHIDRVQVPEDCLDVLAQTVVGMSLSVRWDVNDAYKLIKHSYCYRNLSEEKFISILKYLGSKDEYEGVYSKIWYDEEENVFGRKKGSRMIYFMNLGTIPEESNYRVITNRGQTAGELSEKFVERLTPGDIFVLGGRSFEFVRSKGMMAHVKEASGRKPTVPSWAGEMLPRSFDLSMDVAEFRGEMSRDVDILSDDELLAHLCSDFDIDEGSSRSLISYFKEQKASCGIIPDDRKLVVEEYMDPSGNQRIIFHFPFGRRVNDALSRAYAYRITNLIGTTVSVTMSDDNFMLGMSRRIDISRILSMLDSKDLETILRKAIRDSEIFKLRFRHTASRSFMILRNYMGRPVSVNRQQTRSAYLLESLANMDNMPVIEETYREILEDDMDIKNAKYVLDLIGSGEMEVSVLPYNGTPSPFAHSIILSGFSDIVLMEDRTALLKELHRKVLYRAMGDSVKEFEFEEDQVIPYFREKVGRVTEFSDIVPLLRRTGPLQAFRERGRNIYSYCDVDRKTVDGWLRDLINNGTLGTVFFDDPHVMILEDVPYYASATRRERELNDIDRAVLDKIGENTSMASIAEALEQSEDIVYRSMRKLESMYLITRTAVTGANKWLFSHYDLDFPERRGSIDRAVLQHLECFAPATVQEIAFALSIPESDVRSSLQALVADQEVSEGRFLISESEQYMLHIDHMRLRAGSKDVFDYDTVNRYLVTKGSHFDSIDEYFDFFGSAGSELDVYNRVSNFDLKEWYAMRDSDHIRLGRFIRGKVRFIRDDDASKFAALRNEPILPEDEDLLGVIAGMGSATLRQLVAETGIDKDRLKESIMRLDRALKVVRAFNEREDWGTENTYEVYHPTPIDYDPVPPLVEQTLRAYGPIPVMAMRYILGLDPDVAKGLAERMGARTIYVGDGHTPMLIFPDEIDKMRVAKPSEEIVVMSLYDPVLSPKWAEISARYGDKWIYPLVQGCSIVGALELWEMSGCIEIRGMDLDDPSMLPSALRAIDHMMGFYRMKGVDIVRLREVMKVDPENLDDVTRGILLEHGYHFINGFYAKGEFIPVTLKDAEIVSYVFRKQHAVQGHKFRNAWDAILSRGYIRNDSELVTRVEDKTPIKNVVERYELIKTALCPRHIGYTTVEYASIFKALRDDPLTEDEAIVLDIIRRRMPINKKKVIEDSPISESATSDALSSLMHRSAIYLDRSSAYHIVPDGNVTKDEAIETVIRTHFNDFGIFSAERLSSFTMFRMGTIRSVLSKLEKDGFLVKGFFREGYSTLYWMLATDLGKKIDKVRDLMVLNTQDNLHVYLRDRIKEQCGATEAAVFRGTDVVGSFKGKVTASGAKVEDFKGPIDIMRFVKMTASKYGVSLRKESERESDEWDSMEFYLKSNPGVM